MTNQFSSLLPVSDPRPADNDPNGLTAGDRLDDHAAAGAAAAREEREHAVREALALAAAVGERAARRVEALATRQDDGHRPVLEAFAQALRQVMGREILPAGDGEVAAEPRYRLDAYVLLGATDAESTPDLTAAEQLALAAVGAIATTAPSTVLNDAARDLPALCAVIDSALILAEAQPAQA
ncbi:hypothetical protein [Kitasatospora sp. NPDC059327]|uniref:hypothetical protein n=1 Tax=Kitasatospora sp. NPDC059327 TaxID=3346803 RepID=UPI0036BDF2CA